MTGRGQAPFFSIASALYAASVVYGFGLKLRNFAYRKGLLRSRRLSCRIICIGNISVGGTGKTPMTMHVARELRHLGFRTAIVSRGYRGSAESLGGIVSDGYTIKMHPEQAGDEAYLIARSLEKIPVIVGKKRYEAGLMAINNFQPDVIVLDDGFQHLSLQRDIDLVLLDHQNPFGNSYLLPRGTLREPMSALTRSTACILTGHRSAPDSGATASIDLIRKYMPQGPVFTSSHVAYCYSIKGGEPVSDDGVILHHSPQEIDELIKEPVFGFSGIARNSEFQNTVRGFGFKAADFMEFSDHHRYTNQDLNKIRYKADRAGARRLITTEKDLVRLLHRNVFSLDLIVIGVKVSLGADQHAFMSFIKSRLSD